MLRRILCAAGLAVMAIGGGCSDSSATSGPPLAADPVEATVVAVVLPAGGFAEVDIWQDIARQQEARTRAVARIYRLEPSDPAAKQADLIRAAAAEGSSAIIVLTLDPQEVAPAIAEVRKAGTPVVILDNPVPSEGMPPAPLVSYEDENSVAKKLVAAALADAKAAGFPPDGPALIVSRDSPDVHTLSRIKAIRAALSDAGVRVLTDVKYTGYKDASLAEVTVSLEITPHVAMAFGIDDDGIRGISEFRQLLDHKKRRLILAGYAISPDLIKLATQGNVAAAIIDRRIGDPMKVAFETALALSRGETVANDIRTPTPVVLRTGPEFDNFFPPYLGHPEMLRGEEPVEKAKTKAELMAPAKSP